MVWNCLCKVCNRLICYSYITIVGSSKSLLVRWSCIWNMSTSKRKTCQNCLKSIKNKDKWILVHDRIEEDFLRIWNIWTHWYMKYMWKFWIWYYLEKVIPVLSNYKINWCQIWQFYWPWRKKQCRNLNYRGMHYKLRRSTGLHYAERFSKKWPKLVGHFSLQENWSLFRIHQVSSDQESIQSSTLMRASGTMI